MNKKIKAAIFAAAFISLGGAAYTYDRYGVQDNSTLLANIEAMSCNNEENKENSEGGNGSSSKTPEMCFTNAGNEPRFKGDVAWYVCSSNTTTWTGGTSNPDPNGCVIESCGNKSYQASVDRPQDQSYGYCWK